MGMHVSLKKKVRSIWTASIRFVALRSERIPSMLPLVSLMATVLSTAPVLAPQSEDSDEVGPVEDSMPRVLLVTQTECFHRGNAGMMADLEQVCNRFPSLRVIVNFHDEKSSFDHCNGELPSCLLFATLVPGLKLNYWSAILVLAQQFFCRLIGGFLIAAMTKNVSG